MKNALILLAGGKGKRFSITKNSKPKQFVKIGNNNFIINISTTGYRRTFLLLLLNRYNYFA